jgi:hypothetical protein
VVESVLGTRPFQYGNRTGIGTASVLGLCFREEPIREPREIKELARLPWGSKSFEKTSGIER